MAAAHAELHGEWHLSLGIADARAARRGRQLHIVIWIANDCVIDQ